MATFINPEQAPGQFNNPQFSWLYVEGFTIEEALNEPKLLATGIYGHELPNQHGPHKAGGALEIRVQGGKDHSQHLIYRSETRHFQEHAGAEGVRILPQLRTRGVKSKVVAGQRVIYHLGCRKTHEEANDTLQWV